MLFQKQDFGKLSKIKMFVPLFVGSFESLFGFRVINKIGVMFFKVFSSTVYTLLHAIQLSKHFFPSD